MNRPSDLIDLRSDTVTRPSRQMRHAMAAADVGDDVYGEDPTVLLLQERVAAMFDMEAALFTPTGSMANVLAVRAGVGVGEEVLCSANAHIARAELGMHAAFTGLTMRTWGPVPLDLEAVEQLFAPDMGPFFVATRMVSIENSHNFSGGRVVRPEEVRALHDVVERNNAWLHIDGARIWNAHVATGAPFPELAPGGVLTVCLSKGLGAPVGSLVVGSHDVIAEARVWRKRLGGGMRQVGVLAAAGIYALDHNLERLAEDHDNARTIAEEVGATTPETNIVVVDVPDAPAVVAAAKEHGVLVSAVGPRTLRAVTHLDVSGDQAKLAAEVLARVLEV
ncbi:MAG TPA: GntG family PLP-dependent aldolase [Nocardioidaceae bacterium]|nr:GntG family PLP-dependent aldolase [Nocardioidaceae bacterium]